MAGNKDSLVSESVLGKAGPAMNQAMAEFGGIPPEAPASLGKPLFNAYALKKQQQDEDRRDSYSLRGNSRHARNAAADFYNEEHNGDVDLGYQG